MTDSIAPELFAPGTAEYNGSTAPDNTSVVQTPAFVARPTTSAAVAQAIVAARARGLRVAVQATGHGAGRPLGPETLLIDTRGLRRIEIDPSARAARIGVGTPWGEVQTEAFPLGLLGLSGTSPTVGVAGYTFGGGLGWLTRAHGLAAGSLRAVTYVDGDGNVRRAADDSPEENDRDALWAFRGGVPVGIATELEVDLAPVGEHDLAAGYLLWPASALEAVAKAWSAVLDGLTPAVTSTLALLGLPPEGPFPAELLGTTVVHLSYASVTGVAALEPLQAALLAAAEPLVDTTGQADPARLAGIHLDPPSGAPSRGTGHWLSGSAAGAAAEVLASARVGEEDGLAMIELRHVETTATVRPGAMTTPPGPFLVHAVGIAGSQDQRDSTERALAAVDEAVAGVGVGLAAVSFRDGSPAAGDAFTAAAAERLATIAMGLDPAGIFSFERVPR